jgi:hypothetical protein
MASEPTLRITSKAFSPAAAASLLRATCLTISPLGTPRYSAICEVSGSTSAPTFRLLPKNGIWKPPGSGASPPLGRIPIPGPAQRHLRRADLVPHILLHRPAVGQLHGQRLQVAVAADLQADLAPRGNLPQHPPQLLGALHGLPVQLDHHVVDLQPDLPRRSVMIDQRDDGPANLLELQRLRLLLVHIRQIHAQVALRTGVPQRTLGS